MNTPQHKHFSTPHLSSDFKNWRTLFAASLLFYLPFLVNFLWGNHDWGWVKKSTPLWSGLFEGRFSQFFLQTLLFDGNILPILTLLCGLAIFCGATILLLNLWNIPHKTTLTLFLGLTLITAPYSLSWLYFAFITLSCLSWSFFIIFGFWLLERKSKQISLPISILCFTLALGGYPPVINLIGVIFFTLLLNDISLKKLAPSLVIKKYLPHTASIAISLLCFLLIQHLLKKYGLQHDTYNTAGINLSELTKKLHTLITASYQQFFITTGYISTFYKLSYAIITLLALYTLYTKTPKHLAPMCCFFIAIIGLLFSPLTTLLVAENSLYVMHEPRIDFFGLSYIYIFSATILLTSHKYLLKNIACTLLSLLLIYNFQTISYASKNWSLALKAETNLMERIIKRLEQTPSFTPSRTYTFVQGGTIDFRSRFYLPDNATKIDSYTQTAPYIPWHLPSKAYKFYYPQDFFGADFDIYWSYVNPNAINFTPNLVQYLQYTSAPWPHKNAIYLDNTTIILTLTPDGKNLATRWIINN